MLAPSESFKPGKKRPSRMKYVGVLLLSVVTGLGIALLVKGYYSTPFRIEGSSMAPDFPEGSVVHIRRYFAPSSLQQGDTILIKHPHAPKRLLLLRLIAKGGDTVEIQNGRISVNGQELTPTSWKSNPTVIPESFSNRDFLPPEQLRDGTVFAIVLDKTMGPDSRHLGAFPEESIVGVIFGENHDH